MAEAKTGGDRIAVQNRRARHEYHVLDTWEAGIVLQGTEVKSLRDGKANLQDSFARLDHRGELWLHNLHISPYEMGNRFNHDPLRPRKLLMHRNELRRLVGQVEQKGLTLVPLDLHFSNGLAKVNLALVRGKQLHDKRETLKERADQRDVERAYKNRDD
ncbi:SsrA-binding protein SmpB [Longimicrobium sp.]|uniref:SsrA-binding protein SmpB n=1 Tax=Longimicrobium sp. TaxID=2029185 RepID=UPI003B3B4E06